MLDKKSNEQYEAEKKRKEEQRATKLDTKLEKEKKEKFKKRVRTELLIGLLLIFLVWGYKSGLLSNDRFILSVQKGSTERVHLMLQFRLVSKNEISEALIETAHYNDVKMTKLLIKYGADVNYIDHHYYSTPLIEAAYFNSVEVAKILLDKGADPKLSPKNDDICIPIMIAIDQGNLEMTKLLLEKENNMNYVYSNKKTLFSYAMNARNFNKKITQLLMDKGALPNLNGYSWIFAGDSNEEIKEKVEFSVENKLDINSKDESGSTALNEAVIMDDINLVKLLVEKGVDLEIKDPEGKTALMNAIEYRSTEIIKYLTEHGANVNSKNQRGQSPLDVALATGKREIAKYLQSKGAQNTTLTEGMLNQ